MPSFDACQAPQSSAQYVAAKLTSRQSEILQFLKKFHGEHERPPTRNEIAEHFEFRSPNAAEEHLQALQRKGAIRLGKGIARGIELR